MYYFSPAINALLYNLDYLALGGAVAGLIWGVRRANHRAWTPASVAVHLFAMLTIVLGRGQAWYEVIAFG